MSGKPYQTSVRTFRNIKIIAPVVSYSTLSVAVTHFLFMSQPFYFRWCCMWIFKKFNHKDFGSANTCFFWLCSKCSYCNAEHEVGGLFTCIMVVMHDSSQTFCIRQYWLYNTKVEYKCFRQSSNKKTRGCVPCTMRLQQTEKCEVKWWWRKISCLRPWMRWRSWGTTPPRPPPACRSCPTCLRKKLFIDIVTFRALARLLLSLQG